MNLFVVIVFCFLVIMIINFLNFFSLKNKFFSESIYPIESGFLSFNKDFFFFNLSFFVILILFVLFDIEIIFIIFIPLMNKINFLKIFFISLFIFLTLWMEWYFGKMIWY